MPSLKHLTSLPGYADNLQFHQPWVSWLPAKTLGQRHNPLWSIVRKHSVTSSNFGAVLGAIERNRFTSSLQKRLLSTYNLESVSWGLTHKKIAVQEYCKLGATVKETGIWLHESGILGASPDGIVTSAPNISNVTVHCQTEEARHLVPEIIEIKCPYSCRDMTVHQAVKDVKGFFLICGMGSDNLRFNPMHQYYHQIQGQLYLTGKRCCDLVVFTTKGIAIVRIGKDEEWQPNITKLIDFFFNRYIGFLLL